MCALMAIQTATGYLAINALGLAEAAMARAEDFWTQTPADDPMRPQVAAALAEARSNLQTALGHYAEAVESQTLARAGVTWGDSLGDRLARQAMLSRDATAEYGMNRFGSALQLYAQCVGNLERLEAEATAQADGGGVVLRRVRRALSGDLANWGATLTAVAEFLELDKVLSAAEIESEQDSKRLRSRSEHISKILSDAARPLAKMFPAGYTSRDLKDRAQQLLTRALVLSEQVQAWEFAGIQADRLAALFDEIGCNGDAEQLMRKVITYSARVRDHTRLISAHMYFATRAARLGDGSQALNHLKDAAREETRRQVTLGYDAKPARTAAHIANAALITIDAGSNESEAVTVAESLKAATTAVALMRDMPRGNNGNRLHGGRLSELQRQREELRLLALTGAADEASNVRQKQLEREIELARRALSLRDPRYLRFVDATEIDLYDAATVRAQIRKLGASATLIGVLTAGETIWTYALWADGCVVRRSELPGLIREGRTCELWDEELLAQWGSALLEPLAERLDELGPEDRLVISPHALTYRVPFAALRYRGGFLSQQVCLLYCHGIGMLGACVDLPAFEGGSILCLGGPARPDAANVAGSFAEVEVVSNLFRSAGRHVRLLAGAEATIANLVAEAARFDIIHFACHAEPPGAEGVPAQLCLATDAIARDSGTLTEDRILWDLPLRRGSFVNLAGCTTAQHNEAKPRILGGLVPAFLVGGAGCVIGTLWPLKDLQAEAFQRSFYAELLRGRTPAEALVSTQRMCQRGELGSYLVAREAWGGYVLYGVG